MYSTIEDVRGDERIDSRELIELAAMLRESDDEDDVELVAAVDELENEGIEDWEFGAFFVRADTFEDYARELAEDIGAIPDNAQWPCTCIDWEQAARELAMDYSMTKFLGHDYYVR